MLQFVYRIKFVTRDFVASPQPFDQSAINRFNQSKMTKISTHRTQLENKV